MQARVVRTCRICAWNDLARFDDNHVQIKVNFVVAGRPHPEFASKNSNEHTADLAAHEKAIASPPLKELFLSRLALCYLLAARTSYGDFAAYYERF